MAAQWYRGGGSDDYTQGATGRVIAGPCNKTPHRLTIGVVIKSSLPSERDAAVGAHCVCVGGCGGDSDDGQMRPNRIASKKLAKTMASQDPAADLDPVDGPLTIPITLATNYGVEGESQSAKGLFGRQTR